MQDIPHQEDKSIPGSGESSSTMTSTLHQAAADLSADHKHVVVRPGQGTGNHFYKFNFLIFKSSLIIWIEVLKFSILLCL